MKAFAIAYIASLLTFLVVDAIWLGLVAKKFYAAQMGPLMRTDILWVPAAVFYILFAAGVVLLAVRPENPSLSLWNIAIYGAIVGFIAYGTYNFTNMATLKDWPVLVSAVDLAWGTCITMVVAVAGALAARKFGM